jgi:FG-GAP repeat
VQHPGAWWPPPRRRLFVLGFSVPALLALLVTGPSSARAQGTSDDPLMGKRVLGDSAELLLLWGTAAETTVHGDVFDFLSLPGSPDPDVSGLLSLESQQSESGATGTVAGGSRDATTGDLNADAIADPVGVWAGPGGSVIWMAPEMRPGPLDWVTSHSQVLAGPGTLGGEVRVVGGYFDDDPQQELLIAWRAADDSIALGVYDTNGGFQPHLRGMLADETLVASGGASSDATRSLRFDVATGDLDGDGLDEVVLAYATGFDSGCTGSTGRCWQVVVKAYDYDPDTASLVPAASETIYVKNNNSDQWLARLAVTTGDLDGDGLDEVAVGFHQAYNGSTHSWFLRTLELSPDLDSITLGEQQQVETTTGSFGYPLSLATADMDMDGRDEILWAGRQFFGFTVDDALQITTVKNASWGSMPGERGRRQMVVADLDADQDVTADIGDWQREVVLARTVDFSLDGGISVHSQVELLVLDWGNPGSLNTVERARFDTAVADPSGPRPIALAAGDFGANGIRVVGTPRRSRKSEIAQPIVVLNAPPTHFDVFGGTPYDVSKCYGANIATCEFVAEYVKQTQQSMEVETEVHTDWAVSTTVSGGFTIPILKVGVEASLTSTYGQGFSKYAASRQTFSTTESRTAIRDDRILATVSDYDIFEYPVLMDGVESTFIAIIKPIGTRLQWFPSKSWTAATYVPSHEVGNILSYPSLGGDSFDPNLNPALDETIHVAGTATTLDETCCGIFQVDFGSFTTASTSKEVFWGLDSSVDFDIPVPFIPDVSVEGSYDRNDVTTHTTSVEQNLSLGVTLGSIDTTIGGGTRYTVRPYSYWGRYGALVVDYAVQPELSAGPPFETWWQQQYGHAPDPAFLLPYHYDVEKGLSGTNELADETHDIVFDPSSPAPGQDVVMTARIQNYSLLPTPGPVKVRFFIGDPGGAGNAAPCGATPVPPCRIVGKQGENDVLTSDANGFPIAIQPQGTALARLEWTVPVNAVLSPSQPLRVYALIDPDGELAEVHEDNNKGAVSVVRVPEPGAGWLGAIALATLLGLRGRRIPAGIRE